MRTVEITEFYSAVRTLTAKQQRAKVESTKTGITLSYFKGKKGSAELFAKLTKAGSKIAYQLA